MCEESASSKVPLSEAACSKAQASRKVLLSEALRSEVPASSQMPPSDTPCSG